MAERVIHPAAFTPKTSTERVKAFRARQAALNAARATPKERSSEIIPFQTSPDMTETVIRLASRTVRMAAPDLKLKVFEQQVSESMGYVAKGVVDRSRIGDGLQQIAENAGLVDALGQDEIQRIMADAAANAANKAQPSPPPEKDWWRKKLIDARELCDRRFADLKYVVPGLFPEGVTLLASRPKMGKSWLILQIATAVAGGVTTLVASDKPPLGDVLYLALEDNPRRLQRRLTKYFGALQETWPKRLQLVTEWKRLDQGGLDALREWARSVDMPALIAIDTLKRVRAPKRNGQSDYDADYEACEGLQKLAGDLGISIIVAHHDRKMGADDVFDTVSGTLGLTGGVDTIALLKRSGQGITLHIQGRDMEDAVEKAIGFDRETGRWAILGEASDVQRSAGRAAILAVLKEAGPDGMKAGEIIRLAGVTRANGDQLLHRMTGREIEKFGRGRYRLLGSVSEVSESQKGSQNPLNTGLNLTSDTSDTSDKE